MKPDTATGLIERLRMYNDVTMYGEYGLLMQDAADIIKELEDKYKEAQSLLDACYEVVELWDCQAPSQIEWKRGWLEGARRHGTTTF